MRPGGFAPFCESHGQGEIFKMQCAQIILELLRSHRSGCQGLLGAELKRSGKPVSGNAPATCLRLGVKRLKERGLALEGAGEIHRWTFTAGMWRVFSHLTKRESKKGLIGPDQRSSPQVHPRA